MHMAGAWGITIPLMLLFGEGIGLGPPGMMGAMALGNLLEALGGIWIVRRGRWLEHEL
jgi:Na+-driven multidrug efflux pump